MGRESKVFLLSRLYYLYHRFNDQGTTQQLGAELNRLGHQQDISVQDYPFEYSNYIPYNIESDFKKVLDYAGSDLDSARYYLERCMNINDCPVVNLYMGDLLYQGQDLKAIQYYQKAFDAYAYDPNFLARLFYAYFVRNE